MNSEKLQARIQYLEQKVRELLKHYKDQQKLIQQLQKENAQLRQQATDGSASTGNFSTSPEIGTITKNEAQARDLGSSIDSYIRDIDKSIAYLEQLQ